MRDSIKGGAYWAEYLSVQKGRIARFSVPATSEHNARRWKMHLFQLHIDNVYALYSAGASISELVQEYAQTLKTALTQPIIVYGDLIWLLEMAVLLDVDIPAEQRTLLREKVDEGMRLNEMDSLGACGDDLWVGVLEGYLSRQDSPLDGKRVLFPGNETFAALVTQIQRASVPEAEALIREHMKIWYKLHQDCAWYDTHKLQTDVYVGYWAFDCAALAKIRGLLGTTLQGVRFFPADLLPDGGW